MMLLFTYNLSPFPALFLAVEDRFGYSLPSCIGIIMRRVQAP